MKSQQSVSQDRVKRNAFRRISRSILMVGPVNQVAVRALTLLPTWSWKHRIPVVGREGALLLDENRSVRMTHTEKCHVAQELFWSNGQLHELVDQQALSTTMKFCRVAEVFLDIGAYTGLFALAASRVNPALTSYAYEILPENYLVLNENVMLNDAVLTVKPRLCGVGAVDGVFRVPCATKFGALLPSSISIDWKFEDGIAVPIRNLDDLHRADQGPMAIKIDVEGLEHDVFLGGQQLLARVKPDILCEILERAPKVAEIEAMMSTLGAGMFHVTPRGLQRRQHIVPDKRMRDWVFTWKQEPELRALGIDVVD